MAIMLRPTRAKSLVCIGLIAISFLSPYSTLRLLVVETLGCPLRPLLARFPLLFFRDKPYFNVYGSLAVTVVYTAMTYVVWSLVQAAVRWRKGPASQLTNKPQPQSGSPPDGAGPEKIVE
jgi:hypothetical protein